MRKLSLRDVARQYVQIVEAIEKTADPWQMILLEEKRIIWHNRFMDQLKHVDISFPTGEDVTEIAYRLARDE